MLIALRRAYLRWPLRCHARALRVLAVQGANDALAELCLMHKAELVRARLRAL